MAKPPSFQLPDDYIEEGRQLLNDADMMQWRLGEHLSDGVAEFSATWDRLGIKNGRAILIRQCANKWGCDESTLRDRQNVVEFWKPKMQERYQAFSWSQLRAIKSSGDEWQQYAEWALDNLPCPPDVIRAKISGDGNGIPKWLHFWQKLGEAIDKLQMATDIPDNIAEWAKDFSVLWHTCDEQKEKPSG